MISSKIKTGAQLSLIELGLDNTLAGVVKGPFQYKFFFFSSKSLESFDYLVCAKCSVDTLSVEVSQPFPKPPYQPLGELIPSPVAFIALHCSHYLFIFVSPTRPGLFQLQSLCLLQCILSTQLRARTLET